MGFKYEVTCSLCGRSMPEYRLYLHYGICKKCEIKMKEVKEKQVHAQNNHKS